MENQYKYLGILERALDPSQEKVCFTTENSVVAAGAGSGKTQVLATRFAWLVISKGIKVPEILTLTFTDKAASEMYQRIYATLKYFADYKSKSDSEILDFFKKKRRIENPTAEMIQQFKDAEKDLTAEKKQLARNALSDFTDAHIQTLDSYCGSIVRQCANRYGISPDFSVGSSDAKRNIKDKAFKFVLKYINEPCVQEFADPGKIQEFAEELLAEPIINFTSIATSDGWFTNNFERQKEIIIKRWNELFTENRSDSIFDAINSVETSIELCKGKDKPDKQVWLSLVNDFLENAREISGKLVKLSVNDFEENYQTIKEQGNLLEDFFEQANTCTSTTGAIKDVKNMLSEKTKALEGKFSEIYAFMRKYKELRSMMNFYDRFLSEVNQEKRISSALTFGDVTELALKILLENEDIRNNEKNAYKKIMIDEFQDNNSKNRDLLYLLSLKRGEFESKPGEEPCVIHIDSMNPESLHDQIADKRDGEKLFFVGDEKQSIYKFRNADVSVFNRLTTENKHIFMNFNYRSTPELIRVFNEFFKNQNGIFIEDDIDFEAHYSKNAEKNGLPELPALNSKNVPLHVRFINEKLINQNPSEAVFFIPKSEQIAYDIAKKIREAAEKEFAGRPKTEWKWDDFAILDRSRSNRDSLVKYLSLFNIPFQVDQFKNIFEEGIINDFYNFLRLCVYPSDTTTFASYLCSPFCGLLENSTEIILSHLIDTSFRSFDEKPFVFNPFETKYDEEIKAELSEGEFEKFIFARKEFESYQKIVLQQPITRTLSELWHNKGYKYETMLNPNAKLCSEHFDMIFELARTTEENGKNVSWFIDELANLKKSLQNSDSDLDAADVKYPLERSHAVQIMTIHKSKGLQFKHVFILGCSNYRANAEKTKYHYSENTGISLKPDSSASNYFNTCEEEIEELKELAEFRRVIYVAVTRAIADAYIYGRIDEKDTSATNFRLISDMVYKFYPKAADESDYALEEPVFADGAPFDYQGITPVKYSELPRDRENNDSVRIKTIENLEKNCLVKEPFDSSIHGILRKQPSKMEGGAEMLKNSGSHEKADKYIELTELLRKYNSSVDNYIEDKATVENPDELDFRNFKWVDFGTLVHDFLCKMVQGIDIEKYEPAAKFFKNLEDADKAKVVETCVKMCQGFKKSDLYKALCEAKKAERFIRPEYEFKYYSEKTLFRGSIDLIFENADGSYTLVDYKTDQTIEPEIHAAQQDCYRKAAEDILPHPGKINCVLYYLRFEETVPLEFE